MRELLQECQRTKTYYEWVLESIDQYGDIIDTQAFDTVQELWQHRNLGEPDSDHDTWDWGLRRMSGSEADGMTDDQYAYTVNGELPEYFDGGNKVPVRYHRKLARFLAKKGEQK